MKVLRTEIGDLPDERDHEVEMSIASRVIGAAPVTCHRSTQLSVQRDRSCSFG